MKVYRAKKNNALNFVSFFIFALIIAIGVSVVTFSESEEVVNTGEYQAHNVGNFNCTLAKNVTVTREELSHVNNLEELKSTIIKRADVTLTLNVYHYLINKLYDVEINDDSLSTIMAQVEGTEDNEINIKIYIPQGNYGQVNNLLEERLLTLSIKVLVTGEAPEPTPEPSSSSESSSPSESSSSSSSQSSSTTEPPGTKPSMTSQETMEQTTTTQHNDPAVTASTPGSSTESNTTQNNVETNETDYGTMDTPEDNSEPSDDSTLTAELSAPILDTQPSTNDEDNGSFFDTSHVVMLMASGFIAVGFALSIGSDVSCIRRINRKR